MWMTMLSFAPIVDPCDVCLQSPISFLLPRRPFLNPAHLHGPQGDEKYHALESCNLPRLKHLTCIDLSVWHLVEK